MEYSNSLMSKFFSYFYSIYKQISLLIVAMLLCTEVWSIDYLYQSGKGLEVTWGTDDKVAVTTGSINYDSMEQLAFWTSSAASASRNEKKLYAVGYQLKPSTTYYSYFPYRWMQTFDAHAVSCAYNGQMQNGNANAAHLASFDYQMATTVCGTSSCTFSYKRIGGVLRISFRSPEAMSIKALNVKAESSSVATTAVMDIMTQKVSLQDYANMLTLTTQNLSVTKGQEIIAYIACPSQNLSGETLQLTVTDNNGSDHQVAKFIGPDVKAGCLYDIALDGTATAKQTVQQPSLQDKISVTMATGIANPIAITTDIATDNTYKVQIVRDMKLGDVNKDGDVMLDDAVMLINHVLNRTTNTLDKAVADANNDGDIDIADAVAIVNIYLKR